MTTPNRTWSSWIAAGHVFFDNTDLLPVTDWLSQSLDAGLITVGDERTGRLILDFRDPARPRRKFTEPQERPE